MQVDDYRKKLTYEQEHYQEIEEIHDLPAIFHYWSNRYVRPILEEIGLSREEHIYTQSMLRAARACGEKTPRFISIGAGNSDLEIKLAQMLRAEGLHDFQIECLEMNPVMLERGRNLAQTAGVGEHIVMVEGDFNHWRPNQVYATVMANQALHHVVELENLFDEIKRCLHPNGLFVTNDMIGQNGHMRWPEALEAMTPFWRELPRQYRWNHRFKRHEEEYINHDCSGEGFEGIRAQDILPLLVDRFDFDTFAAFGNIVNVFVDRLFGPNFDASQAWDREFVDRLHAVDDAGIRSRNLSPTQMFAVMTPESASQHRFAQNLSPAHCVRNPSQKERITRTAGAGQRVAAPLSITTTSLQNKGDSMLRVDQKLEAIGGQGPYTFRAEGLPQGLSLENDTISGRVTESGTYTVTIVATDSATPPQVAHQRYTLLIRQEYIKPLVDMPAKLRLAAGVQGFFYTQNLVAHGGHPPFRWTVLGGHLPEGLNLDEQTGHIHGIPQQAEVKQLQVLVSDSASESASCMVQIPILKEHTLRRMTMPQLVAGSLWTCSIELVNPNPLEAEVSISFHGDEGEALALPIRLSAQDSQQAETEMRTHLAVFTRTIPPHGRVRVETTREVAGDPTGWADIRCRGHIHGFAKLRLSGQAPVAVALPPLRRNRLLFPFSQSGGLKTGFALVGESDTAQAVVNVSIWNDCGEIVRNATLSLKSLGHKSFLLGDQFPDTQGKDGYVEFAGRDCAISGLALAFAADGRFWQLPAEQFEV